MADNGVQRTEVTTPCILWTGAIQKGWAGYGKRWYGGRVQHAHRAAYQIKYGPIPKGQWVLHRCDVPRCVNPEHLYLGTPKDNTHDSIRRGRFPAGERSVLSKLTARQVADIRRRWAAGELQRVLAAEYGVHRAYVSLVCTGKRWRTDAAAPK